LLQQYKIVNTTFTVVTVRKDCHHSNADLLRSYSRNILLKQQSQYLRARDIEYIITFSTKSIIFTAAVIKLTPVLKLLTWQNKGNFLMWTDKISRIYRLFQNTSRNLFNVSNSGVLQKNDNGFK